ncbi:MAG: PD40 domain-containing protein [Sphingobacteriales bacterium]|nr:PD40 domain-containing protein [Sphingobacteriales bacterium]
MAGAGRFTDALNATNTFLTLDKLNKKSIQAAEYRKSTYQFAIEYQQQHPANGYTFNPQNLGDSINSANLEYFPSLTIDGKQLVFTRRIAHDEDFYESNLIDGKWSNAKPLSGHVNTTLNEGAQNISQDGEWIIFTGCNYPEGQGSCDLYISYKTKNGWSEAENLGALINTDYWESSPSLSPDKRHLYFASSQTGGYGGMDLWVSHRNKNGKWGRAINLGPTINTSGDESCSFMHADNQTLFFSSNGHPGYGQTDLFYAKKINDSAWSEPMNLGYPVNTIDDEGSLIVTSDGKTAYYASEGKDSRGGLDLYSFQLREDLRPAKTLWVTGKVIDKKTKAGLPSTVEMINAKTGLFISKVQTDEDGNYFTTLPTGKDYVLNVNRKGYLFFSENYRVNDTPKDSIVIPAIPLQPIEANASLILKNLNFDNNKAELQPESIIELEKVIQLLTDNPGLKIQISGHTDNVGKPLDNLKLSTARALAVVNHLVKSGAILRDRLVYKGYGDTKPIASNNTEEGKALNRRTELSVISK